MKPRRLNLRAHITAVAFLTVTLASWSGTPVRAATKTVCIDPGHGGSDIGTSNRGILEKELNLAVARRLGTLLGGSEYSVAYTRTGDADLTNTQRAQRCNAAGAAILVSIHHNGNKDARIDYSTALYQKRIDKALASAIVNAVAPATTGTNRGIMQFASAVLIKSTMPATISEGYFLTNDAERDRLNDFAADPTTCASCDTEAQALAQGIATYFATH